MKKLNYIICITITSSLIILPLINPIPKISLLPLCHAAEKVTPYKPEVVYTKPQTIAKEQQPIPEIKSSSKKRIWPWVVGGALLIGAAAAAAGGGGGGGDGGNPPPNGDTVDVDVSW